MFNKSWITRGLLLSAMGLGAAGCANNAQNAALVGGAGGAALGGLIGSYHRSSAGVGALIGAGAGALGGYLVGNEMDKSADHHRDRYSKQGPAYSERPAYIEERRTY